MVAMAAAVAAMEKVVEPQVRKAHAVEEVTLFLYLLV